MKDNMGDLIELGKTDEISSGTMKMVMVNGHEILLARVGEKYYAVDNRCPHMGGKLSKGKLEGTVVTCPRHGSRFDLKDGQAVRWLKSSGLIWKVSRLLKPPKPLVTYNVRVEDNRILIELEF